ncbi:MAG: response regulator transcription factor [Thermodesulfobacteriota bacterium]|nr:response regulator transcription factor [Thermodesulfobacteriota bacterium]
MTTDDSFKGKRRDGIKVFFCYEDEVFLDKVIDTLQKSRDINVIGSCNSLKGIFNILRVPKAKPDIFFISLSIAKEIVGLGCKKVKDIKKLTKKNRLIVLGEFFYLEDVVLLINGGVKGYILSDAPLPCFEQSVRSVYAGEIWLDRSIVSRALDLSLDLDQCSPGGQGPTEVYNNRLSSISKREWEILELISRGYRNEDIADSLFISIMTVKTHVKNIFRKLECKGRLEAALLFIEHSKERFYRNSKEGFSKIIYSLKKIR